MKKDILKILFFDIETVSMSKDFQQLEEIYPNLAKEWEVKYSQYNQDESVSIDDYYKDKAAVYAEFSEVACISIGILNSKGEFRTTSLAIHDEKELLKWFSSMLNNEKINYSYLCGHNIINFDIPFLIRRYIINEIAIPDILKQTFNSKKWEQPFIDTMQLWKCGQWQNNTSLALLCASLKVDSPKDEMTGKDVGEVYWNEKDLSKISSYCERDVKAVFDCYEKITKFIY